MKRCVRRKKKTICMCALLLQPCCLHPCSVQKATNRKMVEKLQRATMSQHESLGGMMDWSRAICWLLARKVNKKKRKVSLKKCSESWSPYVTRRFLQAACESFVREREKTKRIFFPVYPLVAVDWILHTYIDVPFFSPHQEANANRGHA